MIEDIERAKVLLGDGVGSFTSAGYSSNFVGTPPEIIEQAESILNLALPNDYREFVADYGSLIVGGWWIYGILDSDFQNEMISDGVRATLDARSSCNLPMRFYVVADDEGDELHCIDCSSEAGQIVAWGVYEESVVRQLASSFSEYLKIQIEGVLLRKGF